MKTGVTKSFNLINLGVFAKLWVEVVIIVIVVFLFNFLLFGFLAIFVTIAIVLLYLLRSSSLLRDLLVEGQDLIVVFMVSIDQIVELSEKLCLLILNVLHLLALTD